MLRAKRSMEFKNGAISTPSIDTSGPSRDSYHCYKSHDVDESECSLGLFNAVLLSLVYPYSKLDIEQDEIRKAWFVNQGTKLNELKGFAAFC